MKIYFNGIELIALGLMVICGAFLLFTLWADRYCRRHNNWLTKFLHKLYGVNK